MKISIIIPVYNKEKYLETLLNQVRGQSFFAFECILIDDGSTDNSGKICDKFSLIDTRFKVFHTSNSGVSKARNLGLEVAEGEFITFMDADDQIHIDFLKRLYECMIHHEVDMVIGSGLKIWENREYSEKIDVPIIGTSTMESLIPNFASHQKETGIYGFCWAKLLKRDMISDVRFDEKLNLAEDFAFYLTIYPKIKKVFFDSAAYYYYLQEAENSSIKPDEKIDYLNQLYVNLKYREFLKKQGGYTGKNEQIVNERISAYVFFVLFHTPINLYDEKFRLLYNIYITEKIELISSTLLKGWLFYCLENNKGRKAKLTMKIYRFLRNLRRGMSIYE